MKLAELKWPDVEALSKDTPIVIPIAAHEQHGRHMPLHTDSLLLGEIVRRAEERLGDDALLNGTQLTDVTALQKLTQLKSLSLQESDRTEPPKGLEKLTQLEFLSLEYIRLTNVKGLKNLPKLKQLHLGCNILTDVKGLENLNQLWILHLYNNQLTDVTGLKNLPKLGGLSLGGNQLTNVKGLEKLTQIDSLGLRGNQLTSVKGLEKLTKLKGVDLSDNPDLTKAQIAELQKALPKCKIGHNTKK